MAARRAPRSAPTAAPRRPAQRRTDPRGAASRTAPRRAASRGTPTPPAARGARILVVDREEAVLEAVAAALGSGVHLAARPSDALTHLSAHPADIIIADYTLPEMSGVAFLQEAGRICPGAKKLLLTGQKGPAPVIASLNEAGIDFYLAKPAKGAELVAAVKELWRSRKAEKERDALAAENAAMLAELRALNADLERRVRGRTRELSKANKELAAALTEIQEKNRALILLNETLNVQASVDALTGLFNRREFNDRLRVEWARFRRHHRPLSMIMFDIDHFKRVNDSRGHECGDMVLQSLGGLVGAQQRRQDICCRFGGEEFVILLPETPMDAAFGVAENLRELVGGHPFRCGKETFSVHISLGVSGALEQAAQSEDHLLKLADQALYHAKDTGRARTVIADPDNPTSIHRTSG